MGFVAELGDEHAELQHAGRHVRDAVVAGRHDDAWSQFTSLITALHHHADKEEHGLFDVLRAAGELTGAVDRLESDHLGTWRAADAAGALGMAARGPAVVAILDELDAHIHREEYDLFPASVLALGPAQREVNDREHATGGPMPAPGIPSLN